MNLFAFHSVKRFAPNFESRRVMPNPMRILVMKKNSTSSNGRIPKNRIFVVCAFEMDQVVSVNATMSINERYKPGTKMAVKTNLR